MITRQGRTEEKNVGEIALVWFKNIKAKLSARIIKTS